MPSAQTDMPRRQALPRLFRYAAIAVLCGALFLGASFAWFLGQIPNEEPPSAVVRADAIVVLTGGSSRISDAVQLLALNRGRRLLISGVHPATSQREITRLMPEYSAVIDCCVDLDRSALNTVGNAIETRRWLEEQGFKSLIVVTSNYHIPRAMAELSHQLPDIMLIPFPVVTHKLDAMWANPATAKLLFFEYVKYMLAHARLLVSPAA